MILLPIDNNTGLHAAEVCNAATLGENFALKPVDATNELIAANTLFNVV